MSDKKPQTQLRTVKELEEVINKILLLKDDGIIRLICATVIANRLTLDPVWLLIVAPPSGGKSELITGLNDLDFMHPISTLTQHTFASGMVNQKKQVDLLHRINGKIIALKDFTSILSMNKEAQREVMGQFREIYDGEYVKEFGTGKTTKWKGKIGIIGGVTPEGAYQFQEHSGMGERFILYKMLQPGRVEMSKRVRENRGKMAANRIVMKDAFKEYIEYVLDNLAGSITVKLDEDLQDDLFAVADFATLARSKVKTDFRGKDIIYVPEPEMPGRFVGELLALATALAIMNRGSLSEEDMQLLYKVALDSIPSVRKLAINALTQYKTGTTASLATHLNYPTDVVRGWLNELNALGVCDRISKAAGGADGWEMKQKYKDIINNFGEVKTSDKELEGGDDEDSIEGEEALSPEDEKFWEGVTSELEESNEKQDEQTTETEEDIQPKL